MLNTRQVLMMLGLCLAPSAACSTTEAVGSSAQKVCSTAGLSSDAANNFASPGTQVTWTATAGCDNQDTPTYQFWELPPGGSWGVVQDWSTANTWAWDTTNNATGVYDFQVWVRASGDQTPYESFSSSPFTLATVTDCSSVSSNVTPTGETSIGNDVTIASTASCGNSTAEYEIWYQPPSTAWSILSAYSSANDDYLWDTTNATSGAYNFQVWARAVGSPNDYDTFTTFSYQLDTPCSASSIAFSPPNTALIGTAVSVSATATCGGTPNYQFWQLPPGGSWTVVQDWSANANFAWDTTNGTAGDYNYQVWVRNSGAVSYESFATGSYTLTAGNPCTDAALGASPQSPQLVGTIVTLTGSSATCSGAEYQFWELPPGGSWTMVQDWSTTATYTWDTTSDATGTYNFQVWAREGGSTGSWETYTSLMYQLN